MSLFPSRESAARRLASARDDLWELALKADKDVEREVPWFAPGTLASVRANLDGPEGRFDVLSEDEQRMRLLCARALEANLVNTIGTACGVLEAILVGAIGADEAAGRLDDAARHLRDGSAPKRTVFVRRP